MEYEYARVRDFLLASEQRFRANPGPLTLAERLLYAELVQKQTHKICSALRVQAGPGFFSGSENESVSTTVLLHALTDSLYATFALAGLAGINHHHLEEAFDRIHDSNMSKIADGVFTTPEGKLGRGPSYVAPDFEGIINPA